MRLSIPPVLVAVALFVAAQPASAQLSPANKAGVAMGHLHYVVKDVKANQAFWVKLGGKPIVTSAGSDGVLFPDVVVLLRQGETSGGTEGSVVNHVAFRVKSIAAYEKAGFKVTYNQEFPGVGYVYSPEGERVELFDDKLAINLNFTADSGLKDAAAERHNRHITVPIIAHHIHLQVPDGQVQVAKAWYAEKFGGVAGLRARYDAVDVPGININISVAPKPTVPTKGRQLDHIGFEVRNLEAFSKGLEAKGVKFDRPYAKSATGFGNAFLTDPWGTQIELTEGLRAIK